jgi:hypothetical protein
MGTPKWDTFAKAFLAPALGRAGVGSSRYGGIGPRSADVFGLPLLTPSKRAKRGVKRGRPGRTWDDSMAQERSAGGRRDTGREADKRSDWRGGCTEIAGAWFAERERWVDRVDARRLR